jgi:flagellar motility protein MotE (MotC chaperone)
MKLLTILSLAILFGSFGGGSASETKSHPTDVTTAGVPAAVAPAPPPMPRDDYCANVANLATDMRHALQMKTLEDLQKQIDEKIIVLEKKRVENQALVEKRENAVKTTEKGVVDIFAKMKPDVAAAQFEILDVDTSASILKQLNARTASTILNEMKPPIAAAITIKMAQPGADVKAGGGT